MPSVRIPFLYESLGAFSLPGEYVDSRRVFGDLCLELKNKSHGFHGIANVVAGKAQIAIATCTYCGSSREKLTLVSRGGSPLDSAR